jgi:hypothetical protein
MRLFEDMVSHCLHLIISGQAGPPTLGPFTVAVLWAQFILTLSGRQRNQAERNFQKVFGIFRNPYRHFMTLRNMENPSGIFQLGIGKTK